MALSQHTQTLPVRFESHTRYRAMIVAMTWLAITITLATCCQTSFGQKKQNYVGLDFADKFRIELPPFNATEAEASDFKKRNRPAERAQRESILKIGEILKGNGNLSDPAVAEFFDGYVFPSMTVVDNRVLSKLGEERAKYIKTYLGRSVSGNARSGIIDLTITGMQKTCVNTKLHPAARLNAVYLIGMIDQTAGSSNPPTLPVPSKAAYTSLMKILDSNSDTLFPAYLKVAALAGIKRHVELDQIVGGQIAGSEKQVLTAKLLQMLDSQNKDEIAYWLKRRSMQMLGMLGDVRSLDRALAILKQEDAGFWLRFDALETIGKLPIAAGNPKANEASIAITEFLATSFEEESESIEGMVKQLVFDQLLFEDLDLMATGSSYGADESTPTATGGGRGGGMGSFGGGRGGGGMGPAGGGGARGGGGMGPAGGGARGGGGPIGGIGGGGMVGGSRNTTPDAVVELPVFQLNLIRRRIKALAFTGANVLGGETGTDGLVKSLDEQGKAFLGKVIGRLNIAIEESNVGIIDLDDRSRSDDDIIPDDEEPKSIAEQLQELCAESAKELNSYLGKEKVEPEAAAAPAKTTSPIGADEAGKASGEPDF